MTKTSKQAVSEDVAPKIYELIIPSWNAVIPADWLLQVAAKNGGFVSVGGSMITIVQGTQLTGGPQSLFDGMLEAGYVKELEK